MDRKKLAWAMLAAFLVGAAAWMVFMFRFTYRKHLPNCPVSAICMPGFLQVLPCL